jgi:prolyl-tRNA synthetase
MPVTRWTQTLIPTLRDDPSDAELVSHKLMVRGGYLRKVHAGIYDWLPLGFRSLKKVEAIVREEMNRAGAIEVLLPILTPQELWEESGRWGVYGKEMWRVTDRHERTYALGPTHEEVMTDLVRSHVQSYKQLPLNLFQIGLKFRDEVRPRFGVMRSREFLMKDAYSFDRDEAGMEKSFQAMFEAYKRVFTRCGLKFAAVEADSGAIGGSASIEFMVLADSGEEAIIHCPDCGYAANVEKAEGLPPAAEEGGDSRPSQRKDTPNIRTVEELQAFFQAGPSRMAKTIFYVGTGADGKDKMVAVMMRGDQAINEVKLKNLLGAMELRMATDDEILRATGAPTGFAGPINLKNALTTTGKMFLVADETVRSLKNIICGANEKDVHFIDVNPGRDFEPHKYADLRVACVGDACPRCGKPLGVKRGIEVGHVFKLGTKYSKALKAAYLDEQGKSQTMIMGTYGIGVSRVVAAAIEQNHDKDGIVWPLALSPYDAVVSLVNVQEPEAAAMAEKICKDLSDAGLDILFDDRDERPGVKFKDQDLVGIPLRLVVGRDAKEGFVEIKRRDTGEAEKVSATEAVLKLKSLHAAMLGA